VREVKEETGVVTTFDSLLTFRHWHGSQFGRSDIYAIALLRIVGSSVISRDEYELEDARWMSMSSFKSEVSHPMLLAAVDAALERKLRLVEEEHKSAIPNRLPYKLYFCSPRSTLVK